MYSSMAYLAGGCYGVVRVHRANRRQRHCWVACVARWKLSRRSNATHGLQCMHRPSAADPGTRQQLFKFMLDACSETQMRLCESQPLADRCSELTDD